MAALPATRFLVATANQPGAIAIIQVIGECESLLHHLTGIASWPIGRMRLADFGGIDTGLAVRLNDRVAQLMPHGGLRVVQRLTARLIELGATPADESAATYHSDPLLLYPEADDRFEALTLLALARAASPMAIPLLLEQPERWRLLQRSGAQLTDEDRARSQRLNYLIDPPVVVLAGLPNVGKSTLSNALLGRSMSIALDLPGTTRDYTAGLIELAGLVVHWHDTPGMRQTDDQIELKAIELSRRLIDRADLLIAMRDPATDCPDLPRPPDVRVMNKCDLLSLNQAGPERSAGPGQASLCPLLHISAATGRGMTQFVAAVRDALVPPADIEHPGLWLFDERLIH